MDNVSVIGQTEKLSHLLYTRRRKGSLQNYNTHEEKTNTSSHTLRRTEHVFRSTFKMSKVYF